MPQPGQRYPTDIDLPGIGPLPPDVLSGLLDEMEERQSQRQSPFMLIPNFRGSIKRGDKPRYPAPDYIPDEYKQQMRRRENTT